MFRKRQVEPAVAAQAGAGAKPPPFMPASEQTRWYVPVDGNRDRFIDADSGMPLLHLIRYR
ncbi:hypothetical protein [Phycicoccus sp. Soil748]|uniref:hypothetical protein n=1 Tax=Phycicoccus sp. Soil748 TaxID=1736397 RepID=UPI0007035BA4|nr:hypothetical protein [Phycicoccus sp. Soil748]KRE55609.1 hypothetical protein ASG70_09830 [Phycicoccus sp. Soil748]